MIKPSLWTGPFQGDAIQNAGEFAIASRKPCLQVEQEMQEFLRAEMSR